MITKNRKIYGMSKERLSRARRLYVRIIYKTCKRSPEMTIIFAQRAHANGLYSQKTSMVDIVFWLTRGFFKIDKENGYSDLFGWYRFQDDYGYRELRNIFKSNIKRNKPRIRVAG